MHEDVLRGILICRFGLVEWVVRILRGARRDCIGRGRGISFTIQRKL